MIDGIPTDKYYPGWILTKELKLREFITVKLVDIAGIGCLITISPFVLVMLYGILKWNCKDIPVNNPIEIKQPKVVYGGFIDEGWVFDENKRYAPVITEDYKLASRASSSITDHKSAIRAKQFQHLIHKYHND